MSQPMEKILVRGVNWLGDAVMTTPALQRLREAKPHARIELLTHEKLADLWRGHPSIDDVITFKAGEGLWSMARQLRSRKFDTAVLFPNSPRSVLEVFFARIPQRIGYARNGRGLFLTTSVAPRAGVVEMHKRSAAEVKSRIATNCARETFPSSAHHVHDYLNLVSRLGANAEPIPPLLHVSAGEVSSVRARLPFQTGAPLFALNAGAEYGPAKRWPAERFVAAAAELHHAAKANWVLLGGKGDREPVAAIAAQLEARIGAEHVANMAVQTSLRELCALLKASALLLTNDSGPMHVAAALGTPVVVPFGSTSPELTGPALDSSAVHQIIVGEAPCAPCFRRDCPVDLLCLKSISVEQVVQAARRAL
jgi:heptosyltransferase II